VNPEGKYVVDIDKDIDVNKCTPNTRVALRNDSYVLHKILPTKVRCHPVMTCFAIRCFATRAATVLVYAYVCAVSQSMHRRCALITRQPKCSTGR
jgi:hypothetical protein